jgi:hypothetical protein
LETKAYIINSLTSRLENPADLRYCGLGNPGSYFGGLNRLQLASPRVNIKHMNNLEANVEEIPESPASVFNRLQATLQLYFTTIQGKAFNAAREKVNSGHWTHAKRHIPMLSQVPVLEPTTNRVMEKPRAQPLVRRVGLGRGQKKD